MFRQFAFATSNRSKRNSF